MAREYLVYGYRNTGYKSGVANGVDFDRPFSQAVFENLYPTHDSDTLALQEVGSKFIIRSIYNKGSIKIKAKNTQKDRVFQIDYLKIEAIKGGDNRERAYYFVDTSRTTYISSDTAILYLEIDEQTTANATQTVNVKGIIEKRNIASDETGLNFYPEEFYPSEPLSQDIAYITAESATGYTITGGSIAKTSGMHHLAAVYCDLGDALTNNVISPLPSSANALTVTISGGATTFDVVVENMVLVNTGNSTVKDALNKLRELGAENMIGPTYSFPMQATGGVFNTYTSNGIDLIRGITGGAFKFSIDNLNTIPAYTGMAVKNKKALYQFIQYTLSAPASGEERTYNLQEIISSATNHPATSDNIASGQLQFTGTGVPLSEGALYWKPANHDFVNPVPGYDTRVHFVNSVRGSVWNEDGLHLVGRENAELIARQLSDAEARKELDDKKIDKTLELSKANIEQARLQSVVSAATGLGSSMVDIVTGVSAKNNAAIASGVGGMINTAITHLLPSLGMGGAADGFKLENLGGTYARQEEAAGYLAQHAKETNALGLASVQFANDYAHRTQSLAVRAPVGLDQNRIMGSSLMVERRSLHPLDVARFDLYLTWFGTTVKEAYTGALKDHGHLFSAGDDFSYVKLGLCTLHLPNEPSGWANTVAWRSKIQAELQTGGRYWKKKILDYVWDVPVPDDSGAEPIPPGYEELFFESLEAISDGDN